MCCVLAAGLVLRVQGLGISGLGVWGFRVVRPESIYVTIEILVVCSHIKDMLCRHIVITLPFHTQGSMVHVNCVTATACGITADLADSPVDKFRSRCVSHTNHRVPRATFHFRSHGHMSHGTWLHFT